MSFCMIPADLLSSHSPNHPSWSVPLKSLLRPPWCPTAQAHVSSEWGAILASGQGKRWNKIWSHLWFPHTVCSKCNTGRFNLH